MQVVASIYVLYWLRVDDVAEMLHLFQIEDNSCVEIGGRVESEYGRTVEFQAHSGFPSMTSIEDVYVVGTTSHT